MNRILTDRGGRKAFIQEERTTEGAEVEAEGQDAFADSVCAEENPAKVRWAKHCRIGGQVGNRYEIVQVVENTISRELVGLFVHRKCFAFFLWHSHLAQ